MIICIQILVKSSHYLNGPLPAKRQLTSHYTYLSKYPLPIHPFLVNISNSPSHFTVFEMDNVPEEDSTTKVQVQHVTKKSSDELLRKFAELGGDDEDEKKWKRRKRNWRRRGSGQGDSCESPSRYSGNTNSIVERRSLLPKVNKKSLLLVKIGKSHLRAARDVRNKSILAGIEKTWRLTLEGASKILLEKHYSRHRRLINDLV